MKRFSAIVAITVLLACAAALAQQSVGLPTTEQAVFYAKYVVIAEVVEAKEFDGKNPWQIVKYKLVESLKTKFKDKEFELMFIQTVQGVFSDAREWNPAADRAPWSIVVDPGVY